MTESAAITTSPGYRSTWKAVNTQNVGQRRFVKLVYALHNGGRQSVVDGAAGEDGPRDRIIGPHQVHELALQLLALAGQPRRSTKLKGAQRAQTRSTLQRERKLSRPPSDASVKTI